MRYVTCFSLFCLLLNFQFLIAQAPDTLWTKKFGGDGWDQGDCVQQTRDGGYIIAGSTSSFGAVNPGIWLLKTDYHGDTLWTKTFGTNGFSYGKSVQQTTDGGYIIAGNIGGKGIWILKTDSNGDTLWTKIFGASHPGLANSI